MSKAVKAVRNTKCKLSKNCAPKLKMPDFKVDDPLHKRLDKISLLKHMNKHFACAMIGKAGSGKTSLALALLTTPELMKRVFDKVYVFVPKNSRASIKNNVLDELPDEQVYDNLTPETLIECFEKVEENAKENKASCIIFDDVQQFLKGDCEALLVHMINNRRHNRLSVFVLAQSYKKIPKMARSAMTDFFLFQLAKDDYNEIFKEVVEMDSKKWAALLRAYYDNLKSNSHDFIYISNRDQAYYLNWDEYLYLENDSEQEEDYTTSFEK